jgi:hypothetical protein
MACPNSKNRPKNELRPLGVKYNRRLHSRYLKLLPAHIWIMRKSLCRALGALIQNITEQQDKVLIKELGTSPENSKKTRRQHLRTVISDPFAPRGET